MLEEEKVSCKTSLLFSVMMLLVINQEVLTRVIISIGSCKDYFMYTTMIVNLPTTPASLMHILWVMWSVGCWWKEALFSFQIHVLIVRCFGKSVNVSPLLGKF